MSSTSDSPATRGDSAPPPTEMVAHSEGLYPANVFTWTRRSESFTVVGPDGIVEEHRGVGLRLRDVVRHLMRDNWPRAFEGTDLGVYRDGRLAVVVSYTEKGRENQIRFPNRARWAWDQEGQHQPGQPFHWDIDDDDDDDDDDAEGC